MDPVTMTLMIASSALSAGGQVMGGIFGARQGRAQQLAALENAAIINRQAGLKDEEARLALQRGNFEVARFDDQLDRLYGTQTVAATGGNLDASMGAPIMAQAFSALQGEVDRGLIRADSQFDAANAFIGKANLHMSALDQLRAGSAARARGNFELFSGVLGAATTLLSAGARMGQNGAFGGGIPATTRSGPLDLRPMMPGRGRF